MSPLVMLGIGMLGGLGAVGRFVIDAAVERRTAADFPYGTLVVNLSGSFALGVLVGAAVQDDVHRLASTGLLGGFTTFSTWAFESHRLGEEGELRLGLLNFAASLVLGVAAVWAGRQLGTAL